MPSSRKFDVIVVGVGGVGSAACAHLAKAGLRVLGLEQFSIPHARGSSHGMTRILREGLHENPVYVPLVRRALELWGELGRAHGEALFHRTGSLDVGLPESAVVQGSRKACEAWGVTHAVLDERELVSRFPALKPGPGMIAVHQPGSGFVLPERGVALHAATALAAGAEIHGHERVLDWTYSNSGYKIRTDRAVYESGSVVFCAGAWVRRLSGSCGLPVQAERAVLGWFQPSPTAAADFSEARLPVWIVDSPESGHFYGFPVHGIPGFKLGRLAHGVEPVDPDQPPRAPDAADEADMRQFIQRHFPGADGPVLSLATCLWENTPDRAFIVDALPGHPGAWVIGGLSGHGYKYTPALGELAKDLVLGGGGRYDLSLFKIDRFAGGAA